jgi:hypothetical protein
MALTHSTDQSVAVKAAPKMQENTTTEIVSADTTPVATGQSSAMQLYAPSTRDGIPSVETHRGPWQFNPETGAKTRVIALAAVSES